MNLGNEGNWRVQEIYGDVPLIESQFIGNKVSSTRYTLVTLLPKNLFEQFQRSANLWFLLVSIFQLIPFEINPVDSWTTVVPLAILIFVTLLKDAYNDYYRSQDDKITNCSEYICWNGVKFNTIKSEQILVGNILLINEGQKFPADVVVLGTSSERTFFLDTSGIVGETDLKLKKAVNETHGLIQSLDKDYVLNKMAGQIAFEHPSNDFNTFRGKLKLSGHPRAIELFNANLAYRGSTLHGVEWIIGVVVYTGLETKTYLNIKSLPRKASRIEKKINVWVIYLLLVLLALVIFSVLAMFYLSGSLFSNPGALEAFVMFTILYNNIIPISLFVTMDMVRIFQVFFIHRALNKNVLFKTGDVNENYGQVEYILADKTGTITEKNLKLQLITVGNNRYFRQDEHHDRSHTLIDEDKPLFTRVLSESTSKLLPKADSIQGVCFSDRPTFIFQKLKQTLFRDESSDAYQFVKCLAVCNTIIPDDNKLIGISADEVALVESAKELGLRLISRKKDSCEIDALGLKEEYKILASVPFSSSIKKSRVLIKKNDEIILYVKGSMSEMIQILDEDTIENLEGHELFAGKLGLRTIVMGYKAIDAKTAQEFVSKVNSAKNIPVNSEGRIEMLFQELEKNLILLGLAGLEDVISNETIETIELLQRANIKIWMLSGDNETSTTSSARKSNLFKNDVPIVTLNRIKTDLQCQRQLMRHVSNYIFNDYSEPFNSTSRNVTGRKSNPKGSYTNKQDPDDSAIVSERPCERNSLIEKKDYNNNAEMMLSQHPLFKDMTKSEIPITAFLSRMFFPNSVFYSLSIDRTSFITAMENDDSRKLFCCLLFGASSVCFYDLLPLDKAKIVELVRDNFSFRPVTLAIGDGNGDIPMIQTADIGIGVKSKENSQAGNYSDLVVESFSQLKYLLLLHGHWNYSRMSRSILLFIYKNAVLTVVTFAYIWYSDYSGVSIFSSSLIVGFNVGFTSLPILALGVFDEDMKGSRILEYPELYSQGQSQVLFNWKKMIYVLSLSVVDGIIIPFFIGYNARSVLNSSGYAEDQNITGSSIFIGLVFAVLLQIALDTYCFSLLYVLSHVFSVFILAAYLWFITDIRINNADLTGTGNEIIATPSILMAIFIVPLITLAIHQVYVQYSAVFHPSVYEKIASLVEDQGIVLKINKLENYAGCLSKLYRETSFSKNNLEPDAFEIKKKSLKFNSNFIEKHYSKFYIFENIRFYRIVTIILFSLLVLWTILEAFLFSAGLYYNLMRTVICAGFAIVMFVLWTNFFIKHYIVLCLSVILIGLIAKVGSELAFLSPGALATGIVPAITYILFMVDWVKITYLNILNIILYLISISIYYYYTNLGYTTLETIITILSYMILDISISITSAFLGYYLERTGRLEYKLMRMKEIGVEKSQRILSFLLPAFVKKRVKDGARYIAEDQGCVTVVFCDIVDFDSICAEYLPVELTAFLDLVFKKFDQLCSAIGVTKIETVGKTYMACAGLKDSEAELDPSLKDVSHSRRGLEMGLAMISLCQSLRLKNGFQLQLKIGINSGPVTAGVVGYHKPQFSLVGDTINTASRMCSTIESPNTIQISQDTYDLLENYHGLEFIGNTIEAKGKGTMHTFLVTEAKNMETLDSSRAGMNHLSTILQHSTLKSSIEVDNKKTRRRGSEFLGVFEFDSSKELLNGSDSDAIGKVKLIDFTWGETEKQKIFRLEKTKSNRKLMFNGIAMALATFSLFLLMNVLDYLVCGKSELAIVLARSGIILILCIVIILHHRIYLYRTYPLLMLFIFLMMVGVALMDLVFNTGKEDDLLALEIMYIVLLLIHTSEIPLSKVIWASLLFFIPWVILAIFASNPARHGANLAFVLVFVLINASAVYTVETNLRVYFNLREIAEKEIDKTDKLLTQMMPPHVLENMRQDRAITDKLSAVTLLYADIVGFTAWSSNKTPIQVVGMLSELFTRFDKMCVIHKVYKVHTIGDCYVVMGYTDGKNRDIGEECYNVVKMAQSMIKIINDINKENNSELNMRIGIHTGEIIAGITGTNIVRYDIYGPDVLISNKMESGGMAGRINVSDVTMAILEKKLPESFIYEFNKEIIAKVIGRTHKSYFIKDNTTQDVLS
jgi:magnesium-transporting ATPase (P-type)/class 3 adenylate cyclase